MTERFESHRRHLRAVAYRMLGSLSEAEDALQETWLRLSRADTSGVDNLAGWLTTVVGRVCLDMLRARRSRREDFAADDDVHLPDPIIGRGDAVDPEQQTMLASAVGLALQVVLESLDPAERLAFVLHDMFGLAFDEIAPIVGRSPEATRQLASRARRRVQRSPTPDADIARQREVVTAFFAAAHRGDFDALVAVLDPDVELRSEGGAMPPGTQHRVRGAAQVAGQALTFRRAGAGGGVPHPALVNGAAGVVVTRDGKPQVVFAFTVASGKILAIDILADAARLAQLELTVFD